MNATVTVPGSKSVTNRALLVAALAGGESRLSGVLESDDTVVFIEALRSLGFSVAYDRAAATCRLVGNGGRVPTARGKVWCGSAGTASRFLLAVVAAGEGTFEFDATAQMKARPIGPLIDALRDQGAEVTLSPSGSFPLTMRARGLRGGRIQLSSGDQSSQYLSAVLMAAPLACAPVEVLTAVTVSRPYVDMTLRMMADFGVEAHREGYERFGIAAPARYRGRAYTIEADASTASYFFAAAAVTGGRVRVPTLSRTSMQGDTRFVDVLEAMGARVTDTGDGIAVEGPERLRGVTVDMGDISDTVMTLAAIAPFADGPTTITNIGHIRLKESDRIAAMADNLARTGVRAEAGKDFLVVHPGKPRGATIDPHGDHRVAMAFSVMGLVADGIVIADPACVAKTCPNFYELLEGLY
ncbi:MAG: 3-phosphoshikimate 1-carboxyvinyltransferase [SAR202 cluster bacterium]|nr:3-phosphoshikimate 1-carboxyvinyltransferase [SAR202 cluster bacterium]